MSTNSKTQSLDSREGRGSKRLRILALWGDERLIFPLPDSGSVTVGRAGGVELKITDQHISRQHVKFHLGARLCVEDLNSANGTWVRGCSLKPGETVEVNPGDTIELGQTTMLVVQRTPAAARPVQIHTHEYFEARVDDECGRAESGGATFAVVRVHAAGSQGSRVEERLAASVRPGDVLAGYGPAEHELLWVDCSPRAAEERAAALRTSLHEISPSASVGVACCPRDGRWGAALLERSNAAVLGVLRNETSVPVALLDGAMENVRRILERVAASELSVLFTGETGVGKGLLAAELHRASARAGGPIVALNCAALTETLLEAELFGYEKGIFTGAVKAKPGLLEMAEGGTLLLDEIGEMSLSIQAKLLGVLEDGKFLSVGGLRPRRVDFRLVSCTNRDLEAEIERGTFKRDLYYRIAQFPLFVPPLRERTGEIDELARAFAAQVGRSKGSNSAPVLSPEALAVLRRHPWPGNVRELRNVIMRAVVLCTDGVIRPEHLPAEGPRTMVYAETGPGNAAPRPLKPQADGGRGNTERQRILDALEACGGNQTRAAKLLGIARRTLSNRMDKLRIPGPRKPRK
jgi:two-component system, NtrC family, response regulator AtoC